MFEFVLFLRFRFLIFLSGLVIFFICQLGCPNCCCCAKGCVPVSVTSGHALIQPNGICPAWFMPNYFPRAIY